MKNFKHYLALVEARVQSPDVTYTNTDGKVTAQLASHISGKYTKLMQNMDQIATLSAQLEELKEQVKQQRREDVADLFDADDAVLTRVVETKSVVFTLSKDPKATEAPKYKVILEELEKKLTPDLIKVLTALKAEHVTITQKEPSLKYAAKDVDESVGSTSVLASKVFNWLPKFDARLAAIKNAI